MADQEADTAKQRASSLRSRTARRRQGLQRSKRHTRTVLLGTLAVAGSIVWMAREWELDTETLLDYLLTGFLFVAAPIGIALVGGGLLWLVLRWLRK